MSVLRSRIGFLEFFLGREARRAERRIHQYHIKARSHQIYQCNTLRSIARKQSPPDADAIGCRFCKAA